MFKVLVLLVVAAGSGMAATDVVILGSGTPRADPERSGPAVAVIYWGKAYLFDSGPGVVRRAQAAALRLHIDALLAPNFAEGVFDSFAFGSYAGFARSDFLAVGVASDGAA